MNEFHKSWSLENFILSQNTTNQIPTQVEGQKMSADESQLLSSATSISVLDCDLISSTTFKVTGTPCKCKPETPKKESAVEKAKKHKAMTHNARRRAGGGNLTRGHMKMPKDCAVFQHWTGTYAPTIKLKDLEEMKIFDLEFPSEKREHGFMMSFQEQTLFWNKTKQDFQPEVIKIKI